MTTTVAPASDEELAALLRAASEAGKVVDVRGGGTHHGYGHPLPPDLIVSTERLAGIEAWDPEDMTVLVGAGTRVADLEEALGGKAQTAVLPEHPGASTVGGVIAAGRSSLRRARLLGTRERVLEVTLVTGDGREVRAGGRVVKNVTGYDLPRLVVGAFGSLGVITRVCLKVWPVPRAAATVVVEDVPAPEVVSRPLAVLQTPERITVHLWGTEAEVDAVSRRLGGSAEPSLDWPVDPAGSIRWSLRVPPALTGEGLTRLPDGWGYLAIHGAGEIRLASASRAGAEDLRGWAESVGGHLVVVEAPPGALPDFDPWGTPPPGLDLQRRLIAGFDPMRVLNPGRLPGGI